MIGRTLLCLSACLVWVGSWDTASGGRRRARKIDAPPEAQAVMAELWRRGTCLLSSVLLPAGRESALPGDLGRTPVLRPRLFARTGAILCYAVDGATLWAADDQSLYRVDAAKGSLARRYDLSHGLPDDVVQSIVPAGGRVWLATRGGLAGLDVETGRIESVEGVECHCGRLARGGGNVWLVGDGGAYRLAPGKSEWQKLADFPGRDALARVVQRGFWWALWGQKTDRLIPSVFANDDGLYAVCMNRLLRYDPAAGKWQQLADRAWQAAARGRTVWALVTTGVVQYRPGRVRTHVAGRGLARGRPTDIAVLDDGVLVASRPDGDGKTKQFVGGGISRLDAKTGRWTVTENVDGQDIRFVTALRGGPDGAWAACVLYDKLVQLSAHPGMAHVKRWRPNATGIGLLRYVPSDRKGAEGTWRLIRCTDLPTEKRWVMGQRGTVKADRIVPRQIEMLCCGRRRLWGVYRMMPEKYYSGYYVTAGCLAARPKDAAADEWRAHFENRAKELGLAGEFPDYLLISHSHGVRIVLGEGHPIVLGLSRIAAGLWAVCESGLFVFEEASGQFRPVMREGPRVYWRATSAAAGDDAVWFGGDGGTVSRLDRKTNRLELIGVVPGRKITALAVGKDKAAGGKEAVIVRAAKTKVRLPLSVQSARELPDADALVFDGAKWTAAELKFAPAKTSFSCRQRSNYLYEGSRRVAFCKGVFRPIVLCEDAAAGKLWLGTYSGVASVPLPQAGK